MKTKSVFRCGGAGSSRLAIAIAVLLAAPFGHAGSLSWDAGVSGGPNGGAGTWNASATANWWSGTADVVWPAAGTDNDAVFGGTAGTVSVASVAANDITFNATGYILSGAGTLTLNGGTAPGITTAPGVTATIGDATATVIDGTAGLTKLGAGTLVLNGTAAHTYTGATTIGLSGTAGGTLRLGAGNLLPAATALTLRANPGSVVFDLNGFNQTVGSITMSAQTAGDSVAITTGAGTLTTNGNLSLPTTNNFWPAITCTISGNLSLGGGIRSVDVGGNSPSAISAVISNGGLTKLGSQWLLLTGANSYGLGTTLTAGYLLMGIDAAGGVGAITSSAIGTGTLTFNGGGISSNSSTPRVILNPVTFTGGGNFGDGTNGGKLTFSDTANLGGAVRTLGVAGNAQAQFDGIVSNGGITKTGIGTLILGNSANALTSAVTINAGTLQCAANGVLSGQNVTVFTSNNNAAEVSTLDLNGFDASIGTLTLGAQGSGSVLTYFDTVKTGAGTLTLGGTVTSSVGNQNSGSKITGTLALGAATRTFTGSHSINAVLDLDVSANISGNAGVGLTKTGGSVLGLSGTNIYDGGTILSGGLVAVGVDPAGAVGAITSSATGTGALTFNGGGICAAGTTPRTILNALTFTGAATLGDATKTGKLTLSADANLGTTVRTITVNSEAQCDGIVSSGAGGGITKAGTATLTLTGNNTYLGLTTVTAGRLVLTGANAAASGGMTVSGGVAQFNSPASINGVTRNVTVTSPGAVMFGPSFGSAADIATALATRIVASSSGVIAADNHAGSNFDFAAAGLTSASLGAVGNLTYTGTLTPNGTTYRLGGGGGTLTMGNAVSGAGYSLVVNGNVVLTTSSDFASTTINTGASLQVTTGATTTVVNNGAIVFDFTGSQIYSGTISGSGGLTKAGSGQLTLAVPQTYSGTTTVNGGSLVLGGGKHTLNVNKPLVVNSGGTLDLGSNSQYVGTLTGTGGALTGSGTLTVQQPSSNLAFAGALDGTVNLTLVRSTTLNFASQFNLSLTGVSATTGTLTLIGGDNPSGQPGGGNDTGTFHGLSLKDGGCLTGVSAITLNNGTLYLNNNASSAALNGGTAETSNLNLTDRVNDAASITLNGGRIHFLGRAATNATEALGDATHGVRANTGMSTIIATPGGTGTNSAELTLGSLTRAEGATLMVDSSLLGTLGSAGSGNGRIFVTAALTGNLAPVGPGVGIIPGVFRGTRGTGNLLPVGYVAGQGFVPVGNAGGPASYTGALSAAVATSNVVNPAAYVVASGGQTINSLVQSNNITFAAATDRLTVASGMWLQTTDVRVIGTPAIPGEMTSGLATGELFLIKDTGAGGGGGSPGDNKVNSVITDNGATPVKLVITNYNRENLTKNNFNLTAANTFSGGTVYSGGNILYLTGPAEDGNGYAPIPKAADPAQGLIINNSTVTLQTTAQQIAASNIVTLNGGAVLNLTGANNTLAGLVFNSNGGKGQMPTVTGGTKLTLTGNITCTPTNVATTPLISVALDLNGSTAHDITVAALPEGSFVNTLTPLNGLAISSIISSGGFTKRGAGVLNLTNSGSTYAGQLTVAEGVLNVPSVNNVSANGVLGNSALPVILGGSGGTSGTLEYTGGNATSSKPFTLTGGGSGGFQIDAAAANLALSGALDGAGGLTKSGPGTLTLANTANSYTGNTTVSAGTLVLADNAGLKFVVTNAASNRLTGSGTATLNGDFTLDTSAVSVSAGSWTLVTVAALAETFGSTFTLVGFTPDVDGVTWTKSDAGGNWSFSESTGVLTLGASTAYQTWAAIHITAINASADATVTGDPDGDGATNLVEYAFNGNPLSAADRGGVYLLTADSDFDVPDTAKELLLTVAVRAGTPVFSASTSPTAFHDEITYTIEGSLTLSGLPTKVNVVPTAVTTGLPDLTGSGYEYRSFSLDGSNGLPTKGFMRAKVSKP